MMIFQHTWQQVLDGTKTQTRRLVKPGEELFGGTIEWVDWEGGNSEEVPLSVYTDIHQTRLKWQVGRTYAVQPGRGKKAVGRIRLTGIRREPVQNITEADAIAEGCEAFGELWDSIHTKADTTWGDNPEVWVLEFEAVLE